MTYHRFRRAYAETPYHPRRVALCQEAGLSGPFYDRDGNDRTLEVLGWVEPLVLATEKAVHLAHAPDTGLDGLPCKATMEVVCPECIELGKREDLQGQVTCSTCGRRHIFGYKLKPITVNCLKPIEVDCPGCHGTGEVDANPRGTRIQCPRCHGKRKVEIL